MWEGKGRKGKERKGKASGGRARDGREQSERIVSFYGALDRLVSNGCESK